MGLTVVKLSTAQIIRALGQNEKLDRGELEKAMSTLVEQLDVMANLANLHCALQTDHSVKDTVTQLCTDLDSMFNEVAEVFKKKQLNTEVHFQYHNHSTFCLSQPKKELCEAAQKVGETSDWLLYRLRPDLSESQRTMRVNELASEVAVATAALGQAAKELTKGTPQQKEQNGKVLGGALKVPILVLHLQNFVLGGA